MDVIGPFKVLTRPLTLKPKGRKPPGLGPKVSVAAVQVSPDGPDLVGSLPALISTAGLRDVDKDGLLELSTSSSNMWLGAYSTNLCLEFDLPAATPLAAIELWNYNAVWETTRGVRRADVAVSSDGTTWQTVLHGAQIVEAEGTSDYDEPTVLKLNGVTARKVRLENLEPLGTDGKVGLGKVVFHRTATTGTP